MEPDPKHELALEIELMARIGAGDQQSFAELYERFSGVLFSVIHRILNNQEAAEDVLQEVFIQIWEKAPQYDPSRGKPMTWALTLSRHKAIDRLRSRQRREELDEEARREAETHDQMDERSAFESAAATDEGVLVRQALRQLSVEQRQALELAFFYSMTQSEISASLRVPLATIKARIRRGMVKLRELIDPEILP